MTNKHYDVPSHHKMLKMLKKIKMFSVHKKKLTIVNTKNKK